MSLYDICPDGLLMYIYAQPGARKSEFSGAYNGRLKVKVSSPPVNGKANKELIKFLSGTFCLSKRAVILVKGEKSRNKTVLLKVSAERASSVLAEIEKKCL